MNYKDWLDQNRDDLPEEIARLDHETDDQFFGFHQYLILGRGRTIRKAYYNYSIAKGKQVEEEYSQEVKISRTFRQWSIDNNWIVRANALDEWVDAKKLHQIINRQNEVLENSWLDYQMLRSRIVELIEEAEDRQETMSARELKEIGLALKTADDIGRKTAGLPGNITQANSVKENSNEESSISADELHSINAKAEKELGTWQKEREQRRENGN